MKLRKETLRRAAYILIAYFVAMAGLSISAIPKHLFVLAVAVSSFGCAGYYAWLYKPKSASQPKPFPFIFVMFGCLSLALAIVAWLSPPPTPSLADWFGVGLGMLIGLLLSTFLFERSQ